jgi:hypothetical protein
MAIAAERRELMAKHEGKNEGESNRFIGPFSTQGWWGDRVRRGRDPEIARIIRESGSKRINPLGFAEPQSAALAMNAATHNPYLSFILAGAFIASSLFLFTVLSPLQLAVPVAGFIGLGGLAILVLNVIRIPAWHRARRNVREYLKTHEGTFPAELKWYA